MNFREIVVVCCTTTITQRKMDLYNTELGLRAKLKSKVQVYNNIDPRAGKLSHS